MKWAQLKDVLDSDGVKDKKERKKLFKEYKTKKALDIDLADPKKFEKWATYGDDPSEKSFALNRKGQRKYEVFCGGFLYYHDVEFKKYPEGEGYTDETKELKRKVYPDKFIGNDGKEYSGKDFEHTIYFEWYPKDKGKSRPSLKTKVIIYISPTPKEFNGTPPKPPAPPPPES